LSTDRIRLRNNHNLLIGAGRREERILVCNLSSSLTKGYDPVRIPSGLRSSTHTLFETLCTGS